jgi:ribosomal protein S18 acetylase RimI-like enzyme
VRSVDPTTYLPLRSFSCGSSNAAEREVDKIVGMVAGGEVDFEVVRVAENDPDGSLMGLCVVSHREFEAEEDPAYVQVIARAAACRGYRLPDGGRLGDLLLSDALTQIKMIWGAPMPFVWALVAPDNAPSLDLFAHWGFECAPAADGGYHVLFRQAGVGISPTTPAA